VFKIMTAESQLQMRTYCRCIYF